MLDAFITAVNTQKVSHHWIDAISTNMSNLYTPGYKEYEGNFRTHLDGVDLEDMRVDVGQGKSIPGTSPENVYLEGQGYFLAKRPDGKILYTRRGEFTFDGQGVYKTTEGYTVQGQILNDKGEVLATPVPQKADPNTATTLEGGPAAQATTDIKMWIDPSNGKFLGKYDEYEIKTDGIIYGKTNEGKLKVPLYKIAINNFNNPAGLTNLQNDYYLESDKSGKPVTGKGEIRSGLIETANTDLRSNIVYLQQARMQVDASNKIINTSKQLLDETLKLLN